MRGAISSDTGVAPIRLALLLRPARDAQRVASSAGAAAFDVPQTPPRITTPINAQTVLIDELERRLRAGLAQSRFAAAVGVNRTTLYHRRMRDQLIDDTAARMIAALGFGLVRTGLGVDETLADLAARDPQLAERLDPLSTVVGRASPQPALDPSWSVDATVGPMPSTITSPFPGPPEPSSAEPPRRPGVRPRGTPEPSTPRAADVWTRARGWLTPEQARERERRRRPATTPPPPADPRTLRAGPRRPDRAP